MTGLTVQGICKSFGATKVLETIDFAIAPREFIAFLGPSGSGKSTLLRIIAGLETADAGSVELDGRRIDTLPPGDRNVAMVFQHYALYPHMTVRQNMAFGLRNVGVPQQRIDEQIAQAAQTLEIQELLDRKPGQLSGGQRQRVAIGRAIVKQPKLFLLDEPLSNLDAALRNRTRVELAQLRKRIDAAVIMVTHDQVEAMTLADRIIVMNDCAIQQIGTPMEIYARPANRFVAQFVGSPAMSIMPASVAALDGGLVSVRTGSGHLLATRVNAAGFAIGDRVEVGLRPESVSPAAPELPGVPADALLVERLGDRTLIYAQLSDGADITAEDGGRSAVRTGDQVMLAIDGHAAHIFDACGKAHHPSDTDR